MGLISGFIIMKANPFHQGHEALIDYAKDNCDQLFILVAALPGEPIPYKYRLQWVLSTYLDDPKIEVFGDIINNQPSDLLSGEKSVWWGDYIRHKYGKFDKVFSSEPYGKMFGKILGAENWVFNEARTIVPISATMIREKPLSNWNFLNNFAKDYFAKKIAIIGTETTGKTTLCKQLAKHYNTVWAPEAGDALVQHTKDTDVETIKLIGVEHAKNIRRFTRKANKILFIDTDINITKSYAKFMCNEEVEFEPWIERANEMDLYIYLNADAPYIQDGRRLEPAGRRQLDRSHRGQFKRSGIKFKEFPYSKNKGESGGYDWRFEQIIKHINLFLSKY